MASLIEAEGKRPQDFPKIAEVIYNRLNATPQIKLELDTTVLYAMSLAQESGFNVNVASPYNTYQHAGLPPGPIDNPGNMGDPDRTLPAQGKFLSVLTTNSRTGATLFFNTSAAFNSAVNKYGSTGGGTGSAHGLGLSVGEPGAAGGDVGPPGRRPVWLAGRGSPATSALTLRVAWITERA